MVCHTNTDEELLPVTVDHCHFQISLSAGTLPFLSLHKPISTFIAYRMPRCPSTLIQPPTQSNKSEPIQEHNLSLCPFPLFFCPLLDQPSSTCTLMLCLQSMPLQPAKACVVFLSSRRRKSCPGFRLCLQVVPNPSTYFF